MDLGNKLDGFVWDVKDWFRAKHLSSFYYKWYLYIKIPGLAKTLDYETYHMGLERLKKTKQLYKWQYKKLKKLKG